MAKSKKRRAPAGVKQIHSTPEMPKALKGSKWNMRSRNYFYRLFDKIGQQLNAANIADAKDGKPAPGKQFHRTWDFA